MKTSVSSQEVAFYGAIVPTRVTDAQAWLDKFGAQLKDLMVLHEKRDKLLRVLWTRYLCDCARRGSKPCLP